MNICGSWNLDKCICWCFGFGMYGNVPRNVKNVDIYWIKRRKVWCIVYLAWVEKIVCINVDVFELKMHGNEFIDVEMLIFMKLIKGKCVMYVYNMFGRILYV